MACHESSRSFVAPPNRGRCTIILRISHYLDLIAAPPLWHLSVTEGCSAPASYAKQAMQRAPRAFKLSHSELIRSRRELVREARALPAGAERNQKRQIALSLRRLIDSQKTALAGLPRLVRSR